MSAKKLKDLTQYIGILPYSSEMSGVYQPLLGWKSRRKQERYLNAHDEHKGKLLTQQLGILKGKYQTNINTPFTRTPSTPPARTKSASIVNSYRFYNPISCTVEAT
ncbi:MAG TPA: hypothetical protein VL995_12340 [Cellvibrio sp.]|nr:hypothetical protein [Cellvibrio sp.]